MSSLRKDRGVLMKAQLQGGLNPGNWGGPVVDAKGTMVGVAVSGVRGTQIGFAIPAEFVGKFLNGRIVGSNVGQVYTEGAKRGVPVAFELIDPQRRIKKV
ncbi:MAG: serine protease [Planctomycetes bacterium]|nr:serine protease [Planctomycetota bacterium]